MAPDWLRVLDGVAPTLAGSARSCATEIAAGATYLPASETSCAPSAPRWQTSSVLIVGQDPYPTPGDAVGLSFSVPAGGPPAADPREHRAELREDTGESSPRATFPLAGRKGSCCSTGC